MDSEIKFQRSKGRNIRQHGHSMDRPLQHQNQRMNFSAQLDDGKRGESGTPAISEHKLKCYFCEKDHKLETCEVFKKKDGLQQFNSVRAKKLCDNCCKHGKECKVPGCDRRYKNLTVLHEPLMAFEQKRNEQIRTENSQILARSRLEKMKKVVLMCHVATLGADAERKAFLLYQ